ncbi:uncharacterized protein DS421_14g458390 [Arachis hypogaea]|nr:uncharacterized protein DS421_14g458390 [Arachis hypogaea]
MIRSSSDIPSEPNTASEPSDAEVDDHEEEAHAQTKQGGPEQAVPHHEEPHQIQAADPEIHLRSEPLLQQAAPPTLTETADPQPATESPAAHPSRYDTSHTQLE